MERLGRRLLVGLTYNVDLMLTEHPDVESTLIQRCFNVLGLLGSGWTKPVMVLVTIDISG